MTWWAGRRSRPAVTGRAGDVGSVLVALVLGGLASDATDVGTSSWAAVDATVGLVAIAALWWRRRAPGVVAVGTFVASAVAPLAAGAAIVAVFTVVAHAEVPRRAAIVPTLAVLYLASGVVGLVVTPDRDLSAVQSALVGLLLTVAAIGWGLAVRARRDALASLTERAERAEADQQARLEEARRAERARIAAEMHDVLAHRLTMLSLAAGAIEYRPEASAEQLARAAVTVRSSARLALAELRQVIGVLREDGILATTPVPTAADLERLVAHSRTAGLAVELATSLADLGEVPNDVGRHAYRIVQEGLTNAHKHAPGQPVTLAVRSRPPRGVEVEVSNPMVTAPAMLPGAGLGLVGMRERVELAGGTLDAGPDGHGRHVLRAWLPWPSP